MTPPVRTPWRARAPRSAVWAAWAGAVVLGGTLLAGCGAPAIETVDIVDAPAAADLGVAGSGAGQAQGLGPSEGKHSKELASIPSFTGRRVVHLHRGHVVPGVRGCDDGTRLCSATTDAAYASFGHEHSARLVDASMTPARGGTAWVVELRFAASSRQSLRHASQEAATAGEYLLLLDADSRVLAPVDPVETAHDGADVVRIGPISKAEAWSLVSHLQSPGRHR